jgi:hypothetical protein
MMTKETEFVLTPEQQVKVSLKMQRIARLIDKELKDAAGVRVPFSLFVWGGGRSQYVANVDRGEAMKVMDETLHRWRRGEPDLGPPHMDGIGEPKQ